jgi:RimJ/RimL family protein N-acetyltransferase
MIRAVEPTEITAGTLHLRPPRDSDVDAITAACQDPEIQRWTRVPSPYHRTDAVTFVHTCREGWQSGTSATFLALDSTTAELVGAVGLVRIADGEADIGYWVAAGARGRGVGTIAVGAVVRWGFGALGLERIGWRAAVGNTGSWRLVQGLGFQFEGTLRRGLRHRDQRVDGWIGSLLPDDPRATPRPRRQ